MTKDNLIIYVSSRNNYDMLAGEVFRNINMEGFEFINIDDKSCDEEIKKGKMICKDRGAVFLDNKSRGVQMATQTLIDFIKDNRPNCKWIFCFQHDCFPITERFFSRISKLIDSGKVDEFGSMGFNRIDLGKHTGDSYHRWKQGKKPMGFLGLAHLSISHESGRWIMPAQNRNINVNPDWRKPFIVEINAWTATGINVEKWSNHVTPTTEHHFHLWMPDVSIQFLQSNCGNIVLPELYLMNRQELKAKYHINPRSDIGAREGNSYHFGNYSNHDAWEKKWGWNYSAPWKSIDNIKDKYKGTLIYDFIHHDSTKGPLRTYDFGDY
jgi:hypothetical protein